ncbi:MAG: hypothetical protein IIA08_09120, partial [Proteobacteria bacterium]|nr:hypothetical protein [Pseudomonadota bacterium]
FLVAGFFLLGAFFLVAGFFLLGAFFLAAGFFLLVAFFLSPYGDFLLTFRFGAAFFLLPDRDFLLTFFLATFFRIPDADFFATVFRAAIFFRETVTFLRFLLAAFLAGILTPAEERKGRDYTWPEAHWKSYFLRYFCGVDMTRQPPKIRGFGRLVLFGRQLFIGGFYCRNYFTLAQSDELLA